MALRRSGAPQCNNSNQDASRNNSVVMLRKQNTDNFQTHPPPEHPIQWVNGYYLFLINLL